MSFRIGLWRLGWRRVHRKPVPHAIHRTELGHHARFVGSLAADSPPKTPEWFMRRLREAPRTIPKIEVIRTSLAEVRDAYVQSGSTSPAFSEQDILDMMIPLSIDLDTTPKRIRETLISFQTDFHSPVPFEVHGAILRGFIQRGKRKLAAEWILEISKSPPFHQPTREHFHMLFASHLGSFAFYRRFILVMQQRGIDPDWETYRLLAQVIWDDHPIGSSVPPDARSFQWILNYAVRHGRLTYNESFADEIYQGFLARNLPDIGERLVERFRAMTSSGRPDWIFRDQYFAKLREATNVGGFQAGVRVLEEYKAEGGIIDSYVLSAMTRHSVDIEDLKAAEQIFGIRATVVHYSTLISNNMRRMQISKALAIYHSARAADVTPNAAMVHPLLVGLSDSPATTEQTLDLALDIYRDLLATTSAPKTAGDKIPHINARVLAVLLAGLTRSPNTAKYGPVIRTLFEDIERLQIPVSRTVAPTIVALMKSASTADEAIAGYQRFSSKLDAHGYSVVLRHFRKLAFGRPVPLPSYTHYLQILSDMRTAGFEVDPSMYSGAVNTIIDHSKAHRDPDVLEELAKALGKIHDSMTLDASFSPDSYVLNTLMDAYQRLSLFADCFRVWDQMFLTGRYNHVSVSIVLDACGYSRSWPRTETIAKRLASAGFIFNRNNWHAWIECLCRYGRLNDAVKIVCMHMGEGPNGVQPDTKTILLLLSWAGRKDVKEEILRRIHKYKPDVWSSLPPNLIERFFGSHSTTNEDQS